jgi:hypothetical protein
MLRFVTMQNLNLKKLFLYSLIISISLSALIGIGVILFGNFGDLEAKILAATFTISGTSILGLACGAYLETKRGKLLPSFGIGFSVLSAVFGLIVIWNNFSIDNEFFSKIIVSSIIFAVACSHLSLISIPKLDEKFQWSKIVLTFCVWLLVGILLFIIWIQPQSESDLVIRIIAVLAIIITALTIVTPIFYKLSRTLPETEEIDAEIERLKTRIAELEQRKSEISS